MKSRFTVFALLIALSFVACNTQDNNSPTPQLNASDTKLISDAYVTSLFGVRLAEEAKTRSTSVEAKTLAETVLNDHEKIMDDLENIAAENNVELPMDITEPQLNKWQLMVKEKGRSFDLKFLEIMMEEHDQSIALFEKIETEADNNDLKQAVTHYLTLAKSHQQNAEELIELISNKKSRDTIHYSMLTY